MSFIAKQNFIDLVSNSECNTTFSCHVFLSPIYDSSSVFSRVSWTRRLHELFSCVQLFVTPYTVARQVARSSTISQSLLKFMSVESVMLPNHLILCHHLLLQSFPASGSLPVSQLFASGGQSIGASASATVLPIFRVDFLWDWLDWSCSPGDSQESSPAHFKSISSLVISLLDGPTHIHTWLLEKP